MKAFSIALKSTIGFFLLFVAQLTFVQVASAQTMPKSYLMGNHPSDSKSFQIAQMDPDEAYDPFTDYSEFDEASEEEADINFFKNGRFFTVGLATGYRGFTDSFANAYNAGPSFGVFISYFFDLRFAFSLGFMMGDHNVAFKTISPSGNYAGTVSISTLNFDLKYYLNTQNVTRGLADLNPYFIVGLVQFYRTYTLTNIDGLSKDATMGMEGGVGLEIPLMRKKAYLGVQATYQYVNFADENKQFIQGTQQLEYPLSGDIYNALVILGMNF